MRYIVDVKEAHAAEINEYLNDGRYKSISQFINVAIENQLLIEKSDLNVEQESTFLNESKEQNHEISKAKIDYSSIKTVKMPELSKTALSINYNLKKRIWLWGQINRIFPVKIALRSLSEILMDKAWVSLEEFKEFATNEAIAISTKILQYETRMNKNRDEKISAGLPTSENYKSQDRYKFHFLATIRTNDEKIDGALSVLRFVDIVKNNNKSLIGITKEGVEFAKIKNPVLDNGDYEKSLINEEIEYYLNHIKKYVKNEWDGIKWILNKIGDKGTNRESLNHEMIKAFQKKWDCTEAVINTQRSGIMGRMTELNLIDKKKEGIYVTYFKSDFANSLIH